MAPPVPDDVAFLRDFKMVSSVNNFEIIHSFLAPIMLSLVIFMMVS